jgi:hypothetical protein
MRRTATLLMSSSYHRALVVRPVRSDGARPDRGGVFPPKPSDVHGATRLDPLIGRKRRAQNTGRDGRDTPEWTCSTLKRVLGGGGLQ